MLEVLKSWQKCIFGHVKCEKFLMCQQKSVKLESKYTIWSLGVVTQSPEGTTEFGCY